MVGYRIIYTKDAAKDIPKLKASHLDKKAKALIEVIKADLFQAPPPFEKLLGDMDGLYSRRINIQHRLVYEVYDDSKTVKVISMWSHYENVK